jgi:hypothetical protein
VAREGRVIGRGEIGSCGFQGDQTNHAQRLVSFATRCERELSRMTRCTLGMLAPAILTIRRMGAAST